MLSALTFPRGPSLGALCPPEGSSAITMSGDGTRGEGEEVKGRAATKNSFGNAEKCCSSIKLQSPVKRISFKYHLF